MTDLTHVDRLLWEVKNQLRLFDRITPINVPEERERFRSYWQDDIPYNPRFRYGAHTVDARLLHQLDECEERLTGAAGDLAQLYRDTVTETRHIYRILNHLGDSNAVADAANGVYGPPPTEDERQLAEQLLSRFPERTVPGTRRATAVYKACRTALQDVGMDNWGVTYTDNVAPSVSAVEQVIKIPDPAQGQLYSEGGPWMTAVHEASHGLRAANGYDQPYQLLGMGVRGHQATDEGLAILLEMTAGRAHPELVFEQLRRYALRTVAAASAHNGRTFWQTFDHVMRHTDEFDIAWRITLRAYRGGNGMGPGVVKDHIYLRGLRRIASMLTNSDDSKDLLDTLYLGKYGYDDLDTVRRLYQADRLQAPAHLPFPLVVQDQLLETAGAVHRQEFGRLLQESV